MGKFDDTNLFKSQNASWYGIESYWNTNGTKSDYKGKADFWGRCFGKNGDPDCSSGDYAEYDEGDEGYFGDQKMYVYEPCNYASNIAYYHSVTKICDYPDWQQDSSAIKDIKRSFAALGVGSAFMHGTHTYVGHTFDVEMISVIAYQAHQTAIARIPSNSSILIELSETPRKQTSKQIVNNITEMFYDQKVPIWAEVLETSDFPHDFELSFAAFVATCVSLIAPWSMT